jgi:hypothetical protein
MMDLRTDVAEFPLDPDGLPAGTPDRCLDRQRRGEP